MQAIMNVLDEHNLSTNYLYINTAFGIFNKAIEINDYKTLDILHKIGFDIKTEFNEIVGRVYRIKFELFIYLEKYGVDILFHLNKVAVMLYHQEDINGLRSCLEYGADANYILSKTNFAVNIDQLNCLLEYGVDLNRLDISRIESIVKAGGNNSLPIIKHLVENGLDLTPYLNHLGDLLMMVIYNDYHLIMDYVIQLRSDIDSDNILYMTCRLGAIECVKVLLNNGVNIHIDNDSIINFIESNTRDASLTYNWYTIAKILIKSGAVINDINYTFCSYIRKSRLYGFDEELFTYFLDMGVDFNRKLNPIIKVESNDYDIAYILEAVVYFRSVEALVSCLKYGADPHIDNDSPLKIAIDTSKFHCVKLLLDLGSVLNPDFECETTEKIVDLFDQLAITHKLTFMEKVD
jgi:ankyrin repeat protein